MSFDTKHENAIKTLEDEEIKEVNVDEYEHLDEEQVKILKRRNAQLAKEKKKKEEDRAAEAAAMKQATKAAQDLKEEWRDPDAMKTIQSAAELVGSLAPITDEIIDTQFLRGKVLVFTKLGKIFEVERDEDDNYKIFSVGQIPVNVS